MFYAQIVKQYITSTSNNNSQGNSTIVKAALKELDEGTHDGGEKYWRWYGFNGRVEWCAIFFHIMLKKLGLKWNGSLIAQQVLKILKLKIPGWGKEIYLKVAISFFFDWDCDSVSDHVGIVEKVENEVVYTIEGNSGDKIAKLSYEKNSPYIMGYGTP